MRLITILGRHGGRSVAAPAPAPSGPVPSAPTNLDTTGSLVGQMTVIFSKPRRLGDGAVIAGSPVTSTVVYVSNSEADARAGTFATSSDAGTASQTSAITGLSAGTKWIWAKSTNANGTSYASPPRSVVVT